jgi:hypothetical protein
MGKKEVELLFVKYLNRYPEERDYKDHSRKTYSVLENEILNCEEYKKPNTKIPSKKKIAILISGHIRKNQILESLRLLNGYDFDVFIHTWDNIGVKGTETILDSIPEYDKIESTIKSFPNLIDYKIENNKEYIDTINQDSTYFNFSSPEIFIKSQLYSINSSFKLLEKYSKESNINYSLVMKVRFDSLFEKFVVDESLMDDINNYKIIFAPNHDCGHEHPDSDSTTCLSCEDLYYKHKQKHPHCFEHTHVICDVFAYGSFNSMKDYCSCHDVYESINESFIQKNLENIEKYNINLVKEGNVYFLDKSSQGHIESLYYINCSYPERILQKHLKDYLIPTSKNIKIKFIR